MGREANYIIVEDTDDRIIIRDVGPYDVHLSITNGAEGVVERLWAEGKIHNGKRLFYFDTENIMDELTFVDGRFITFKSGPLGQMRL